jgi:hypothetical protein
MRRLWWRFLGHGLRAQQQVTDPRSVDLDAEVVGFRMRGCQRDQRLAVAEADLERTACVPAEHGHEVEHVVRRLDSVARPQFLPGTLLRRRHPSGADHEAADPAMRASVRARR